MAIKINEQSVRSLDESDEDIAYAAGVGITLFEHLSAQLESADVLGTNPVCEF